MEGVEQRQSSKASKDLFKRQKKISWIICSLGLLFIFPSIASADTWTIDYDGNGINKITGSASSASPTELYYAAMFANSPTNSEAEWDTESTICSEDYRPEYFSGGAPAPCDLASASAARRRGYRCWKYVKVKKHEGWLFFQWGISLIDKFCGYVRGRVVHHWADVYTSTGIGWDNNWVRKRGSHSGGRVTSMGAAKFSFGPIHSVFSSVTVTVGINANTSGGHSTWST